MKDQRQGMPPEEARKKAMIRMGGWEQAKEEHRNARGLPAMEAFGRICQPC